MSNSIEWGKGCAACGKPAEGEHAIHRDGFDIGPEVPLCNACGSEPEPTLLELWVLIAERGAFADAPEVKP